MGAEEIDIEDGISMIRIEYSFKRMKRAVSLSQGLV
jgi:hypothetical protein